MAYQTDRRSFLTWALFGLGAIFSAIFGVPVVAYILDPLGRKGAGSDFKRVDGVQLDDLTRDTPKQGTIRDTRTDAWTLYPNDVKGRVWVVLKAEQPRNFADMNDVALAAFNGDKTEKDKFLLVFTTICPHLGCSINSAPQGFACPCHNATFDVDGEKSGQGNPAPRSMDTLDWQVDPTDRKRIIVKYENFQASQAAKKPA